MGPQIGEFDSATERADREGRNKTTQTWNKLKRWAGSMGVWYSYETVQEV